MDIIGPIKAVIYLIKRLIIGSIKWKKIKNSVSRVDGGDGDDDEDDKHSDKAGASW